MVPLLKGKRGDRLFFLCQCLRKLKLDLAFHLIYYKLAILHINETLRLREFKQFANILNLIRAELNLELVP